MLEFYEYGEKFLDLISDVGAFLLDTKLSVLHGIQTLAYSTPVTRFLFSILNLPDTPVTLGYFLLGYGLISLLFFKFVKFILDILL